ncbi:2-polyprenyl-6-methoxyphenol hydroxylase-like FAD-dependent oxidoreductase [Streptomyces pseudovenezuelae]|uniref:2-polyprenyl-6-methoxyphenol hydroxylase-like FAD-dependent oxidoreductase n=2 Tax=Streptomyces pseudovenezuelae TaxID=67350 RepID=A0ABT6LTW6_9ACTN|nr:2-polyprenyl-6-methoxyphenol hydroxylase-like FAD-dependent oxidoreductase [Streptomyces pseudovenezuelae]
MTNTHGKANACDMTNAPDLRHLTVLVSGASVAGPALALNLARRGARVTVVERAPELRGGGFAVDFRGHVHRTVLTAMGIWDEIHARQTHMGRQTVVDADGDPRVDLPAELMSGDVEIFRGELAQIMYERTKDDVDYVFGDSVTSLTETPDGMDVTFERGAPRRFDLVVGADGLHSTTRRLAFGDEAGHLRFFDHYVAAFEVPNHLGLDRAGRLYSEPGRAVVVGNYDGDPDRAGALLVFRSEELSHDRRDVTAQKRILMDRFAGMGWEAPAVLKALEETDDLYFDAIAQIHVDRLTQGRVALLGDAGYGATMGGMGTGVAIVGAYVLAGELALAGGDHRIAFAEYESRIRDFAKGCQKISGNAGPFFAPATERRIRNRDRVYRLLGSRLLAGFFKRLTEKAATDITLREYPALPAA